MESLQTIGEGDVIIFKVRDLLSSALQDAIHESLYRDCRKFVLDLREMPRLAMDDVSIIISACKSIRAKSGEMVLVPPTRDSLGLIDKMRLPSLLATHSTVEAAVKSFGQISRAA